MNKVRKFSVEVRRTGVIGVMRYSELAADSIACVVNAQSRWGMNSVVVVKLEGGAA